MSVKVSKEPDNPSLLSTPQNQSDTQHGEHGSETNNLPLFSIPRDQRDSLKDIRLGGNGSQTFKPWHKKEIVEKSQLDKSVLDELISMFVLSPGDREEIVNLPSQTERNQILLDILIDRPYNTLGLFCEILEKTYSNNEDIHKIVKEMERLEPILFHQRQTELFDEEGDLESEMSVKHRTSDEFIGANEFATTGDKERYHLKLQKNFKTIVQGVDCTGFVCDLLIERDIITKEDQEDICSTGLTRSESCRRMLTKLLRKDFRSYNCFLDILRQDKAAYAKLADEIDKTTISLTELKLKNMGEEAMHERLLARTDQVISRNVGGQNHIEFQQWKEKDKNFVPTRASKHVFECVTKNACVTITGPAGCGKTFLARHTALLLKEDGYDIIIIKTPKDIRDFYNPYKPRRKNVFIVDDICGNFTASQEKIDNWSQFKDTVDKIVLDQNCKIIVSCRLQIFRSRNFKTLSQFVSCECNLVSESLCLSLEEKTAMIQQYTGESIDMNIIENKLGTAGAYLPLLCFLYRNKKEEIKTSALDFLQNPFDEITKELNSLSDRDENSSKYKICSLALCVLFNNKLEAGWFKDIATEQERKMLDELSDAFGVGRLSKKCLEDEINNWVGTLVIQHGTKYKAIHDKVFDFLTAYFGKKITSCIFKYADSDLLHERFRWNLQEIDKSGDMEYLVDIPDEYLDLYIGRMMTDWSNGKVIQVFNNINMIQQVFRQHFIRYLSSQGQYNINHLIEKKDSSKKYETHGSTALIQSIKKHFVDLFEWLLNHNESNVSICDDNGKSPLWIACDEGNVEIVTKLLEKNPDVNLCNESGQSPLWIACYRGDVKIVSKLLEKDPDVNLCDDDGRSPLWIACDRGNVDIVTKFLEKDPDVMLCYNYGRSPLWIACDRGNKQRHQGNVEIVSMLLKKDPDVNLCYKFGQSPLWIACDKGNVEIVSMLLKKDPDVNLCDKFGQSPLWIACAEGNVGTVSMLLEKDPDVNTCSRYGWSPLWIACARGNVEIVSKLLAKDPDVNLCDKYGRSPLWKACFSGNVEIVSKLLEKDPDVNLYDDFGQSPLWKACNKGNVEIVSKLLEKDPDVNLCDDFYGKSPLWIACDKGNVGIVSKLLEKDPDVDLCDKESKSPLWIACENGNVEIVSKILEKDPDVNLCDDDGRSPLWLACNKGNVEIVSKLLEKDPDINLCDKNRRSPLWIACDKGDIELLEKNPDVNLSNDDGQSPLRISYFKGNAEIISKLLEKHPDVNLCDKDGRSPLMVAEDRGNEEIIDLLKKYILTL